MLASPHVQVPSVYFPDVIFSVIPPIQNKPGIELEPWPVRIQCKMSWSFFSMNYEAFLINYEATILQFYLEKITRGLFKK